VTFWPGLPLIVFGSNWKSFRSTVCPELEGGAAAGVLLVEALLLELLLFPQAVTASAAATHAAMIARRKILSPFVALPPGEMYARLPRAVRSVDHDLEPRVRLA
jgi:hypothetical protein